MARDVETGSWMEMKGGGEVGAVVEEAEESSHCGGALLGFRARERESERVGERNR